FPGTKPLSAFFENLLFSDTPQGKGSYAIIRHQNRVFVESGISKFVVGLKREKGSSRTFTDISSELHQPLNEILKGERIIEFPTLFVWLQGEVDSDATLEKRIQPEPLISDEEAPKDE
ncbi:hypothetical protein DFQ29_004182, partial [Apophysomyces sp. BC1021]